MDSIAWQIAQAKKKKVFVNIVQSEPKKGKESKKKKRKIGESRVREYRSS